MYSMNINATNLILLLLGRPLTTDLLTVILVYESDYCELGRMSITSISTQLKFTNQIIAISIVNRIVLLKRISILTSHTN